MNAVLPAEAASLLRQLLDLTRSLQADLEDARDEADDERLAPWLDLRETLLERLAALPPEARQINNLSEEARVMLLELDSLGALLITQLEARRNALQANQGELRTAHSAMQAYMPQEAPQSHYIEEQS